MSFKQDIDRFLLGKFNVHDVEMLLANETLQTGRDPQEVLFEAEGHIGKKRLENDMILRMGLSYFESDYVNKNAVDMYVSERRKRGF